MKKLLLLFFLFTSSAFAVDLPILPNPKLTPGDIDHNASTKEFCTPGYTRKVRNVPLSVKRQVFVLYGIDPTSSDFEVDHLISLELGGSNDIKNLWPQSYDTQPWNAYKKDGLEHRLHALVCNGKIDVREAQKAIASDWISAYNKYMN